MTLTAYNYMYLITNIFGTYTVYKFMGVFFERSDVKKKLEFLSYVAYFIVISFAHVIVNIPIVTLLCNIVTFFSLTFNYKVSVKIRLTSTVLMYSVLMAVESIVVILTGYINLSLFNPISNYSSISGIIITKTVSYVVVLITENFKNIKKEINISNVYWISVLLIPLGTLYISLLLFQNGNLNERQILTCITILLTINILILYLYDIINKAFEDKFESILLKKQNSYYHKQFEVIDNSYKITKSMRHDIKNHLSSIYTYINKDEKERALSYIAQIIDFSYDKEEFAHSGNMDIDSILNYKLKEATEKDIKVSLELKIPQDLNTCSIDMVIILGNLLDNAIDATVKLKGNKKINARLSYKKNMLFIHIDNTFNGLITYYADKIITSKKVKDNHGIGLNSIKNVIKKYDGTMEIHHTKNNFEVDIMMYII